MYIFLITIHVIASLVLIASILFQAGRGGGLSEMFGGGGSTQTIFGTSAATFLKRITTISAIVFLTTSLTLAVFSSRKSHSIMERMGAPGRPTDIPAVPVSHGDVETE